jgi:hypothetical protein
MMRTFESFEFLNFGGFFYFNLININNMIEIEDISTLLGSFGCVVIIEIDKIKQMILFFFTSNLGHDDDNIWIYM